MGSNEMRVVAINSSPRKQKGNTRLILDPFLEGMKDAGAEISFYYANELNIKSCNSDPSCWLKTQGKCIHNDDMDIISPMMMEADMWVLATPLYADGMTGTMKIILERAVFPLLDPFIELREGICRHPFRAHYNYGKIALVSTCGFWEMSHFNPLIVHMEALCKNAQREFAGALLRPHAGALRPMMKAGLINDVFDAAKDAGKQLMQNGKIKSEILDIISRELLPLDKYIDEVNTEFRNALKRNLRK
jgi:multimeric flavodoxin WrbA